MMLATTAAIVAAVATVDDPEYPGVSIVDLGLYESCDIDDEGRVIVGLIPTFSGCPALAVIAEDVERAVKGVDGVNGVIVEWLRSPVWDSSRLTQRAHAQLASEFTVAVQIGRHPTACPRCGHFTVQQSMFGPSRCRAVHRCPNCSEAVEVMRT